MIQRLSSFKFKDILQYANPRGLLIGSVIVATPLILVNEKLVYVRKLKIKKLGIFKIRIK